MRRVLLPIALLIAGCATAPATRPPAPRTTAPGKATQPAPDPEPARPYGTVDLDERETPLAQVIDKIALAADRPIAASVSTSTLVTLTLHAAPWRDALDYLVQAHHLVRRDQGRVILLEEPPHNHLEATGCAPGTWFLLLAKSGGFSIIIPGNLRGAIDATLTNVRYEDVLRATAREQGLEVEPIR